MYQCYFLLKLLFCSSVCGPIYSYTLCRLHSKINNTVTSQTKKVRAMYLFDVYDDMPFVSRLRKKDIM